MNKNPIIILLTALVILAGCSDAWDDHVAVSDNVSQLSLADYIASNSDCSQFAALLTETGIDQKIDSAQIYTIWVPGNEAMALVDQSLIDTDDEKKIFVLNHIVGEKLLANAAEATDSLKMLSGKKLFYQPGSALIDGVALLKNKETVVKNGVIQFIASPLTPRLSIWDWILTSAPDLKFVTYLKSLDYMYFDAEASGFLGTDEHGTNVYSDSVMVLKNKFLQQIADLSAEDSSFTFLIPSDDVFTAHFDRFEKYYRMDDRESNVVPTSRDSAYIWLMVVRDFVSKGAYSADQAPAVLQSYAGVNVPFNAASVSQSYSASNGYVHVVNTCDLMPADKILPIVIDASLNTIYRTSSSYGSPTLYYRERGDALNGYDVILDNQSSSNSEILDGLVLIGEMTSSCRYRVKIRAVNDFGKSYRYSDTTIVLNQLVGPVTVIRDPQNDYAFKGISDITNKLTDDSGDVDYTTTYYVPFAYNKSSYSDISEAASDEVDLGSYYFRNAEYSFFRLVPLSAKMAVTLDYIRLEPILED